MTRKLAISLFIVAVASSSSLIMAAAEQSLHFRSSAPAEAAAGSDDLRTGIKAQGLAPIGSNSADLIASPADTPEVVTNKAGRALCEAAFGVAPRCVVIDLVSFVTCSTGPSCCDRFTTTTAAEVNVTCDAGIGTAGFTLERLTQVSPPPVVPDPQRKITAAASGPGSSVTHYGAENKNVYRDIGSDPAAKTLIQVRPGGLTGTVTISIYHNQSGANPRVANVNVTSANNDPVESQALHNAIEAALEATGLPIPIVAITHTRNDAIPPLTAFGWLKQADHFTEITNMTAAQITEVRVAVPASVGLTIEGSDGVFGAGGIPTLNEWGIVVLVVLLLLSGYMLMRRQKAGTAAA